MPKELLTETICEFHNRCLYPMKREYLSILKDWRNAQMNVLRQARPLTAIDQEGWFQSIMGDKRQKIFAILQIISSHEKQLIGYCGLTNINDDSHKGEISFLVNPARADNETDYREDFLSTLWMLSWYGFEHLKLQELFTETYCFRKYHIRILEEFGLKIYGTLPERKMIGRKKWDSILHRLLKDEWPNIKGMVENVLAQ